MPLVLHDIRIAWQNGPENICLGNDSYNGFFFQHHKAVHVMLLEYLGAFFQVLFETNGMDLLRHDFGNFHECASFTRYISATEFLELTI